MRGTVAVFLLVAACATLDCPPSPSRSPSRSPSPAPIDPGPAARVSFFDSEQGLGGCVTMEALGNRFTFDPETPQPPGTLPMRAFFLEPDGTILLLVKQGLGKVDVPLICGTLSRRPVAGARLALGVPGNSRWVAYEVVPVEDLMR